MTGSLRLPYRPASTSSSINPSDRSTPFDSEDELPRSELSATVDPSSSSMHLLAENLKKLEKSGKLKNWGNFGLGDKIKSARRSSKKFTGYALSKLGGGQSTLLRKVKKKSKDGTREVHSDTEEGDDLTTSSTPLLQSMSASTHNLTLNSAPPPKPPRTFKTKFLGQDTPRCLVDDEDEEEMMKISSRDDDFSTDVLNAIKKVSSVIDQQAEIEGGEKEGVATAVVLNGCLPSEKTGEMEFSMVKRSESSPLLSHSGISSQEEESETSSPDLIQRSSHSIGLQPIAEANSEAVDTAEIERAAVRLVSSVPLRRKPCPQPPTSSLPQSYIAPHEFRTASFDDGDEELRKVMDDSNSRSDKRLSIMSTTSADFFSAASSEANSMTTSPDLLRHETLSPPILPPGSTIIKETETERVREVSSVSTEEYFSTPPSSPNAVDQADKVEERREEQNKEEAIFTMEVESATTSVAVSEEKESEEKYGEEKDGEEKEREVKDGEVNDGEGKEREKESEDIDATPTRRDGRKRSLTLSESMSFPANSGSDKPSRGIKSMSKDDNFQTEYHHLLKIGEETTDESGVLATSFSTQDLVDIFGEPRKGSGLPSLSIEPVEEEPTSPLVAAQKEGEEKEEEEVCEEEEKIESASVADRSASPTISSLGGSTSPEIIEPVIIPDDITPDTVRDDVIVDKSISSVLRLIKLSWLQQ